MRRRAARTARRTLKVPQTVRDFVRTLHPVLKKRIRAALSDLLSDPSCGKPLKGELDGYWTLRVGRHRIVYKPDREGLKIAAIGPRRTVYEHTARLLLKRTQAPS